MPILYFFRMFVEDQSDYDNDPDEWVSFDNVSIVADFAPRDPDIFQAKDHESIASSELQKIAIHKAFRAVVDKNADIRRLRTLFSLEQQELIVHSDIELYQYDDTQGKDAAILLSSMAFKSKITHHSIDSSGNYGFRFQIIGSAGLDNAPVRSGPPWIAETETHVGLSPAPAKEDRRLVAAFAGIDDSGKHDTIIDKHSESRGSFSMRPWRKAPSVRMRFWIEAGLAAMSGLLGLLTLFTRDWIEALTGFDPDNHDGSFEWAIVAALFLVCVLSSLAARADWRRLNLFAQAGI